MTDSSPASAVPLFWEADVASPTRLDRWMRRRFPTLTQGQLEKWSRLGKLKINSQKITTSVRLQPGDTVFFYGSLADLEGAALVPLPPQGVSLSPKDIQWLESLILWEDEEILVLNKPTGLAVQGGSKTLKHLDGYLQSWGALKKTTYRLVHRLDKETSGVFVVAKTLSSAHHMASLFHEGKIEKKYWAIVEGTLSPGIGVIKDSLRKKETSPGSEKVVVDPVEGKRAITHYRTLKRLSSGRERVSRGEDALLTWMELIPQTGRTHQIRVHCQSRGAPILGDDKYTLKDPQVLDKSKSKAKNIPLHLHARQLEFVDRSGALLTFVAPPPPHFEAIFSRFRVLWEAHQ